MQMRCEAVLMGETDSSGTGRVPLDWLLKMEGPRPREVTYLKSPSGDICGTTRVCLGPSESTALVSLLDFPSNFWSSVDSWILTQVFPRAVEKSPGET